MDILRLSAVAKTTNGKKEAKRMRRQGRVPAIVYGHGENIMCELSLKDLKPLIDTPKVYLIELTIDGKTEKVILKDVDFHPVSDLPLHLDFYRYVESEPITMRVPVRFQGHARGVKAGGKLVGGVRRLRVRGLPADMPDILPIDVSNLRIGDALMVADVSFENLQVIDAKTVLVAAVKSQRGAVAVADDDDEAADADDTAAAAE